MSSSKTFERLDSANSLTKEQIEFLNKFVIGSWNFVNGFVDVDGGFDCISKGIKDFKGIKFGKISRSFHCSGNQLTSLEGFPRKVAWNFHCSYNRLTSLIGSPQNVGGYFDCSGNLLTSLLGAPQKVCGGFDCSVNLLSSLEGAPQKLSEVFYCYNNLVSFETLELLWNKLKEVPIYSIALASIWRKIPEDDRKLMKKDLDPDYLDYSSMGDFGLI